MAAAMNGYLYRKLNWAARVAICVAGLMMMDPGFVTDDSRGFCCLEVQDMKKPCRSDRAFSYSNHLMPYFLLNLSTRPLVSTSFCLPV